MPTLALDTPTHADIAEFAARTAARIEKILKAQGRPTSPSTSWPSRVLRPLEVPDGGHHCRAGHHAPPRRAGRPGAPRRAKNVPH